MIGLSTVRNASNGFPFVNQLQDLAAEARSILGAGVKIGYAADWSEYHSHRPDDGSGDVYFHLDKLWAHADIDFVGIDNYLPLADWRDGSDHLDYDAVAGPAIPHDPDYLAANVEGGELYDWYYASAGDRDDQVRTPIADEAEGKDWVFRQKDLRNWWLNPHYDRPGGVEDTSPTDWVPEGKPVWFTEIGCPAIDKGANQPNVFLDAKSSESFVPYYSSGARDDAMQRAYLAAAIGYWSDDANNPASGEYSGRMVAAGRIFVWAWDARPTPSFPLDDVTWADAANWDRGHWISGRLGAAPASETVAAILDEADFDHAVVNPLPSVVDGVTADRPLAPRAVIEAIAIVHAFDAVESGGELVFTARAARGAVATLQAGDLVVPETAAEEGGAGDPYAATRAQETDLPAAVRIGYGDPAIDDQPASAEARRGTGGSERVLDLGVPVVMPAAMAASAVERALYEAWVGRETLDFGLPPSRLGLDPGDVVAFAPLGEDYRLSTIGDGGEGLSLRAARSDAGLYLAPAPAPRRPLPPPPPAEEADTVAIFLDGPLLRDEDAEHRGYVGAAQAPWRSGVALYKSPETSGYVLAQTLAAPAVVGVTTADFYSGPAWRWDRVNDLYVAIEAGTLASASEAAVLNGANVMAIENSDGEWEILQFATATLNGTLNYILSDLLRGQRGSEHAMRDPVAAGARLILLTTGSVRQAAIADAEVGLALNWRYGPADFAVDDAAYVTEAVTFSGRGRRPYAPAEIRGVRDDATGDWTIGWVRRTRIGGDSWEVAEVPLAEASEAYELEILDGGDVVRTFTGLAAAEASYTAAMQTTDFGGAQTALAVRAYQLSALYGRGVAGAADVFDLRRAM